MLMERVDRSCPLGDEPELEEEALRQAHERSESPAEYAVELLLSRTHHLKRCMTVARDAALASMRHGPVVDAPWRLEMTEFGAEMFRRVDTHNLFLAVVLLCKLASHDVASEAAGEHDLGRRAPRHHGWSYC